MSKDGSPQDAHVSSNASQVNGSILYVDGNWTLVRAANELDDEDRERLRVGSRRFVRRRAAAHRSKVESLRLLLREVRVTRTAIENLGSAMTENVPSRGEAVQVFSRALHALCTKVLRPGSPCADFAAPL